jgi:hypothetical protein
MARIRTIKPEFFGDEKLNALKRDIRLLFIGMWVFSDDYGTIRSNPVWIKSNVFPYDEELRVNDVKTWLDALVKARMLEPFQYNSEGFYNIRTFDAHQKVEKKSKPIVPLSEKEKIIKQLGNSRGIVGEYSVPEVVSSNSTEEIGSSKGKPPDGVGDPPKADAPMKNQKFYLDLKKDKKVIVDFIRSEKPDFIEPFVDLWNIFADEKKLARVSKINDHRKKKFIVRIREASFDFIEILKKAGQSEFILTGNKWFGFDWIMECETNYLKVIEGNFDKKDPDVPVKVEAASPEISENDLEYLYERFCDGQQITKFILPEHYELLLKEKLVSITDELKQEAWAKRIFQLTGSNQRKEIDLMIAYQAYDPENQLVKSDKVNFDRLVKRLCVYNYFVTKKNSDVERKKTTAA